MEQFTKSTDNYVVSDQTSTVLGAGREEAILYGTGCDEKPNPVMKKDMRASGEDYEEQKVGDHMEDYA